MQSVSTVQVFKYLNLGYTFIGWNQLRGGKEFLQDKAVRQALTYALNVDQVVEKVLFGEGVKMVGAHSAGVVGLRHHRHERRTSTIRPRLSSCCRATAGPRAPTASTPRMARNSSFRLLTNSGNKIRETFVQVAAEQYKQIGINVEPKTESFEALVDRLNQSKDPKYGDQGGHDFDAVVIGWSLTADPDMYSIWDSKSTHAGREQLHPVQEPRPGQGDRRQPHQLRAGRTARRAIKTANQILNDQQPYNFGFAQNMLLGVNKKIQSIEPGPFAR